MTNSSKTLDGIELKDLVHAYLGPVANFVDVPKYIAEKIIAADPTETLAHIEWIEPLKPRMWRIEDWRTSSKRAEHKKQLSELERGVWVRAAEFRSALSKRIMAQTGLDESESEKMIETIIRKRNKQAAAIFNVNLDELLEADEKLKEFQQAKK
jgi:Ulp1 family protease